MDYVQLYHLETYLFETVRDRFDKDGYLSAFDFFCIVIWKANRAKSKVALRLLRSDQETRKDLNAIVRDLTAALAAASDRKDKMRTLIDEWGLRLPMASAILTVLYPEQFTVFDVNVCGQLGEYHKIADKRDFESLWTAYEAYREAVSRAAPAELRLRDKDRYLWGKSFHEGLEADIQELFCRDDPEEAS